MNKKTTKFILNQLNIFPKKQLGQNFLIDNTIAKKIISESEISDKDVILEIGSGLGSLTDHLVQYALKVYAVEIESQFCSYLTDKFSSINNIEIINGDILEIDLPKYNKIISNIPYSITGKIFEKIFFKKSPPHGILTIEKSIADRIFIKANNKRISRITITVNSFLKPIKKHNIPRSSFYPIPKIDLALIKLSPSENMNPLLNDAEFRTFYLKFIAGIMPYKNKDLLNALYFYIRNQFEINLTKEKILEIIYQNNFLNNKLITLKINDFITLSKIFFNLKENV